MPNSNKLRSIGINDSSSAVPLTCWPIPYVYFPSGIPAYALAMPLIVVKVALIYGISTQQAISFEAMLKSAKKVLASTPFI